MGEYGIFVLVAAPKDARDAGASGESGIDVSFVLKDAPLVVYGHEFERY